jgi:hypothetical protein
MTVWKSFISSFFKKLTRRSKTVFCFYLCVPVLFVSYCTAFSSCRRKTGKKYYARLREIILVLSCSIVKRIVTLLIVRFLVSAGDKQRPASIIKMFILCFIDQSLDGLRRGNGIVEMTVHREV